jgi:FMN reductase
MTSFLAIHGAVTPPGRLATALQGAIDRAGARGHTGTVLHLGDLRLDYADGRSPGERGDDTARLLAAVAGADAVIVASPVYRASLSGALKNALDLLPAASLHRKPVGIVSMGYTLHHYLGAEWHLRDILSWFGALTAPNAVYLSSSDFAEGQAAEDAAARLDALVDALVALDGLAQSGAALGPTPLAMQYGG